MAKVARLYYVQGARQQSITERLQIHQSTVSRLLKRAREQGLVRFSVASPQGTFSELEDRLCEQYLLKDAVVVDGPSEETALIRELGEAAAYYIETTLKPEMAIGISSWSRSLFAMVEMLHPGDYCRNGKVVQILGGAGNPDKAYEAMYIAQRLASLIGATPVLLQAPAVVASTDAQRVLSKEPSVLAASALFEHLDLALVGIGSMDPSQLLASTGHVFSRAERKALSDAGAVGDVCFRFFDAEGKPIKSLLMKRVMGIELGSLRKTQRVVGVAGGRKKTRAVRAALLGRWVDVLITDRRTAESLVTGPEI
jgi:DNA-binding transcriptional regulator LsrR (DeoR family)